MSTSQAPPFSPGSTKVLTRNSKCGICGASMPIGSSFRMRKNFSHGRAVVCHLRCTSGKGESLLF